MTSLDCLPPLYVLSTIHNLITRWLTSQWGPGWKNTDFHPCVNGALLLIFTAFALCLCVWRSGPTTQAPLQCQTHWRRRRHCGHRRTTAASTMRWGEAAGLASSTRTTSTGTWLRKKIHQKTNQHFKNKCNFYINIEEEEFNPMCSIWLICNLYIYIYI